MSFYEQDRCSLIGTCDGGREPGRTGSGNYYVDVGCSHEVTLFVRFDANVG